MKNVFLIGNGFDLHHYLPTKYLDFMCVAEYLISNTLSTPLNAGTVFSKCVKSTNIQKCYAAHKEVFDSIEVPFEKASEITNLLRDNLWFDYFLKTLDTDSGWIDFEKEISTVITTLDEGINQSNNSIILTYDDNLLAFILSNFKFFIEINSNAKIYPGDYLDIKKCYLKEYPHNSNIYIADKKKIFEELYKELLNFSKALGLYLSYFVEIAYDLLHKDTTTEQQRIKLLNLADCAISFNYTNTLERFYSNKTTYHIHGIAKNQNIVLGVNPNKSDDSGTNNTTLIKFKKYYQREIFRTAEEYIKWYRETIGTETTYRVITIGHSIDETDKDILTDMFRHAKEIYITYYDETCKDDYINNIIKLFGNDGYNEFKKEKGLEFIQLSDIEILRERISPPQNEFYYEDHGKIEII
jgi:hypothetical protein